MGRFEKRPDNPHQGDPYGAAETALRAVTEELQIIQRNLLMSLQEDIKQLQVEKNRLADDIKLLKEEKQELQEGRQIGEQQALVRQLAQVLANHLSSQLQSSLENLANQAIQGVWVANGTASSANSNKKKAELILGSLDDTLTITFNTLQQELKNYQSSFLEQLSRMQSQQQQGEAMLADLVNSLRRELEKTQDTSQTTIPEAPPPQFEPIRQKQGNNSFEAITKLQLDSSPQPAPPLSSPPKAATPVSYFPLRKPQNETTDSPAAKPTPERLPSRQRGTSSLGTGLGLIVLSTLVASVYNVAIKVIFHPDFYIFGVFEIERLIVPTLGSSILILMLRMLVVVPLMLLLAPILHPRVWQDLQNLIDSARNRPISNKAITKQVLVLSIVSGGFLFLSQVLIYLAIGQVATGMAIALFFVYPIISGLLSWLLFRDRLTLYASGAITAIGLGELLVLGGATSIGMGNTPLASTTAIASGIAFGFYVILTRICAAKLHPVTFTLINFATMLLLSLLSLMLPLPQDWSLQINPTHFLELILSAFILGVLTLFGYLFNNFAIRKIGASQAAIFGAIVPALTVILAGLIIQETIEPVQVLGVLLVTLGAGAFSYEKIRSRVKPSRNISRHE